MDLLYRKVSLLVPHDQPAVRSLVMVQPGRGGWKGGGLADAYLQPKAYCVTFTVILDFKDCSVNRHVIVLIGRYETVSGIEQARLVDMARAR